MKKLSAWITLSALAFFGSLAVVSCGSDEATGGGHGGGGLIGSGGGGGMDGGIIRDSGSDAGTGKLGQACATDSECGDSGLICIKRDDPVLGGGAPPKGLCTTPCTQDDTCLEFASDAYCVAFGARNSDGYCIEGCTAGSALGSEDKCHAREEFVCTLIGVIPSSTVCDVTTDCASGELCDNGTCGEIVTGCMPLCGGDHDCASGFFCDFTSGLCVQEEPTGLDINQQCDPDALVDPCNGFCLAASTGSSDGSCSAFCNLGSVYGCGFSGEGQADAACLFSTIIAPDPGAGDVGLCGQL
ncbi:MAG TPA: hypothetical protein VGP93_06130, partial [Polyangiaceae bacterium]|nr:hypothetical protein [Polyangiaceae bacterium]